MQTYGYGDLLGVIIAEAQQTAWLKAEAKESEVRLTPPPPAGIVKKPGRRRS